MWNVTLIVAVVLACVLVSNGTRRPSQPWPGKNAIDVPEGGLGVDECVRK